MADFYAEMAGVSREMLAPPEDGGLGQGSIVLVQLQPGAAPANSWDPPSPPVPTRTPLDGAATGVGKDLVGTPLENGSVIVAGDLQVIVAPWGGTAQPENVLELDGAPATVMKVENIPAIGTPAAIRLIVRR
jgi:hypothetical protein